MGKSEIVPMPLHKQDNFIFPCKTAIMASNCHLVPEDPEEAPDNDDEDDFQKIPEGMQVFSNQVAGHTIDGRSYGLITHNGTILKPITNRLCGEREMEFYGEVNGASDQTRGELRDFIPKYFGSKIIAIGDKNIECIILEDLTKGFKEPCIMDIKIGRRTWDPQATYKKIVNEEAKYHESKRDLSFCIPGFQVYKISINQLCKYDKTFGKNLSKETVPAALKMFLNADSTTCCRSLIVQFLAALWRIQMWLRKQRYYHFYSSSLLLIYDARRLREHIKCEIKPPITVKLQRSTSLYRPLSLAVLNKNESDKVQTGFSGQLTNQGPILKPVPNKIKQFNELPVMYENNNSNVWKKSIRVLKRTHSFQNDYDKDMQNRKQDYTYMLDELCMDQKSELWASVKMIDFAHAFPAERCRIDQNYLDGVDNLVRIFEEFLIDSE